MNPHGRHIRNTTFDLLGDYEIRCVRIPVEKLQTAVNRVMVGQANEVHAAGFRDSVHVKRTRVAVTRAEEGQVRRETGVIRMDVKVSFHGVA